MKYLWCTIQTENLEESMAFYQEAIGLKIEGRFPAGPGREIAFLSDDNVKIELLFDQAYQPAKQIDGISIGFQVDNLEDAITHVSDLNIEIEAGPIQPNPMVKFFYVRDPNGVKIQIVQQM